MDVLVVMQRQAPLIQKAQKTVDVPQIPYNDMIADVPVLQRQVPTIQTVQKSKEITLIRFLAPEVDVPVVIQRQAPFFQKVGNAEYSSATS